MKKITTLFSVLAVAVMLVLLPGTNSLTVQAAESATYSVKYIGGDVNDWRYMPGSVFDDNQYHRELYLLQLELKEGDAVIVYGADAPSGAELVLDTAKLGNLTVHQGARAIVHTAGVKDCYVLAGSFCAINGDVTNAYLYDNTTCNFNNNVLDMNLYYGGAAPASNISCLGTVGRFRAISTVDARVYFDFYSVNSGKFILENGTSQVPHDQYSREPGAEYLQAMGLAATPATPAPSTPSDEYDSVPKTGDNFVWLWLLCASAICFIGSLLLKKKAN